MTLTAIISVAVLLAALAISFKLIQWDIEFNENPVGRRCWFQTEKEGPLKRGKVHSGIAYDSQMYLVIDEYDEPHYIPFKRLTARYGLR